MGLSPPKSVGEVRLPGYDWYTEDGLCPSHGRFSYMRRLILHHFYSASIRKAWVHTLSTWGSEKNDAKLTAVCITEAKAAGTSVTRRRDTQKHGRFLRERPSQHHNTFGLH
jgi:hypothetical protein